MFNLSAPFKKEQFGMLICIFAICLSTVVSTVSAQTEKKVDDSKSELTKTTDEDLIKAQSRAFSKAYVSGDIEGIRDLYTVDGVILPPGRTIRGKEKIGEYFAPSPNRINVSHSMDSKELKIDGDTAIDIGVWNSTSKNGDSEAQTASGQYLVIWRRGTDGIWKIQYDMWHRPTN